MSAVIVRVVSHEVRDAVPNASPFACYTLLVTTESGNTFTIHKRWNDLKQCEEALRKSNTEQQRLRGCPRVEAHSWKQLTGALSPDFLQERAEQMQTVLQAWLKTFDEMRLEEPARGPAPLLAFLCRASPGPGSAPTPRQAGATTPSAGAASASVSSPPSDAAGAPTPVRLLGDALLSSPAPPSEAAPPSAARQEAPAVTPARAEAKQVEKASAAAAVAAAAAASAVSFDSFDGRAAAASTDAASSTHEKKEASTGAKEAAAHAATSARSRTRKSPPPAAPPSVDTSAPSQVAMRAPSQPAAASQTSLSSWSMLLLWGSLVLLPLIAIFAKEWLGVFDTDRGLRDTNALAHAWEPQDDWPPAGGMPAGMGHGHQAAGGMGGGMEAAAEAGF